MIKCFLHSILLFSSLCVMGGQKERDLVRRLKEGNIEEANRLIQEGADPSIAMIEARFFGPDSSDIQYLLRSEYGANDQIASRESDRQVTDLSEISDVITSAQLSFYKNKGNKDYYMIAPDPSKNPQPDSGRHGVTFFKTTPIRDKYLTWIQGVNLATRGAWIETADLVRRGYGVLGFAQDLLSTDMMDVIVFHPDTRTSADYLFDLIHPEPGTMKNQYQIGLLLSYWEPNVYAWVFGTDAAMKAYPQLEINPAAGENEGYDLPMQNQFRKIGTSGLEAIPAEERQRVLHELDPQDNQFRK